jgi:hypothetical protein
LKSQVAPVMLHLPIAGQVASFWGATPGVVQGAVVMLQMPGTFAHGTFELHAAWVLAQVPIEEQSLELRHCTEASLAQVPITSGHVPGLAVQAAPPLLQAPGFRQVASEVHDVPQKAGIGAWVQVLPLAVHLPKVVAHAKVEPQAFAVQGCPPHCAVVVHVVVPLGQVFCAQSPPWIGQVVASKQVLAVQACPPQFALLEHTV